MHVVVVFMEAERGHEAEMREALIVYSRTCLEREEGCHRYDVAIDPIEGATFLLYQIYDDETAYMAHRELPHYAEFRILTDPWTRSRRVLTYDLLGFPRA